MTTVDQQKIRRTRTGLVAHDPTLAQPGYTLFAPMYEKRREIAAQPGYVEGHVSIGPLTPVERIDTPVPTVPPEFYAAYKIVILRPDGQTEVTRADEANLPVHSSPCL